MIGRAQSAKLRPQVRIGKAVAFTLKLLVTSACFWYLTRQINLAQVAQGVAAINVIWATFAVLAIMVQIPMVALRWEKIVDVLSNNSEQIPRQSILAITAIGIFFGQVFLYAAGDTVRAWMLAQLDRDWRLAVVSVLIDRAIGVSTLLAFGFVILLFPSALTALGGHRDAAVEIFGALLVAIAFGLLSAPYLMPLLGRWRFSRWIGTLGFAAHNVLLRSKSGWLIVGLAGSIHIFTIVSIWCIGKSLALSFPILDAAVLFALIQAVSLIPISVGGWGVREVAVVALLTTHGLSAERALFFSVCFGLVLVIGSLPGAFAWAFYSPTRLKASG